MPGSHSGPAIDKVRGVSHGSIMSSMAPVAAGDLLKHKPFLLFLLSRSFSRFATQIGAVAIGWQVYDMTGSAFQLGMIGLVQFLPTALLVFVAGHAADRYERKRVVQVCEVVEGLTALFLALGAFGGWLTVTQIFVATFVLGIVGAFESPALAALLPVIAPQGSLQRATAISSGAAQIATITGPALGGLAYALAPSAVLTEGTREFFADKTDKALDTIKMNQAIPRNLESSDLVGTVHWLVSDASRLVTGQTIAVDGGTVMH